MKPEVFATETSSLNRKWGRKARDHKEPKYEGMVSFINQDKEPSSSSWTQKPKKQGGVES